MSKAKLKVFISNKTDACLDDYLYQKEALDLNVQYICTFVSRFEVKLNICHNLFIFYDLCFQGEAHSTVTSLDTRWRHCLSRSQPSMARSRRRCSLNRAPLCLMPVGLLERR